MTAEKIKALPRAAYPEEVGVSSQAILNLLDECERRNFEYHGLMILRHGKVVFEQYRKPYEAKIPHSIYSFSKSIAVTAAGFAVDEGLFSLDDPIGKHFPEYRPKRRAKLWDKVTLRHVITMTSGLAFDVFHQNSAPDWIGDYLSSKLRDEPGRVFHYTNECAYLISVLIRRLTEQTMWEYLTPRLFEPLGIEIPFTETDRHGNPGGGWGVIWKLEDSAKFIQCYLDGGKWLGKQVIPAWWAEEATKKQVSNSENLKDDSNKGYGYQFWICALPGAFAARGMFCQQGIGMREQDAVFCFFGAEADEQKTFDVIYPHFPAGFFNGSADADPDTLQKLREREAGLSFPKPPKSRRSPLEAVLKGKKIRLRKQLILGLSGYPQSVFPMLLNQMFVDRAGNLTDLRFDFREADAELSWKEGDWLNSIPLGLDGEYRVGKIHLAGFAFDSYSYAYWEDERTLAVNIRPIQTCVSRTFRLRFQKKRVNVSVRTTPSYESIANNLCRLSFAYLNNNKLLCLLSRFIFKIAPRILEGNLYGRIRA